VGKLAALVGDGHLGRQSDAVGILERLKSVTGGDPQNVDRKNAPELANVVIKARFTVAVNELPRFPDASAALRSRMLVIPFRVSFEGREDVELGDRLLEEIPGVTNWALRGLLDLRESRRFLQPGAGSGLLDEFGRLSSPVRAFLEDRCEFGPDYWVKTADLRAVWQDWCRRHGHEAGSDTAFGAKVQAADPRIGRGRRREAGALPYVYTGVRPAVPA
jgi:putative DNA primase/helicase